MLIRDHEDYLELTCLNREGKNSPAAGDAEFSVRVQTRSPRGVRFHAECTVWVQAEALASFATQLRCLEELRKGSARLEGIMADELTLEIRPYDRAGHMAVFGHVGQRSHSGVGGPHWCSVAFGIPFCPSELPTLVKEFSSLVLPAF